MKLILYSLDDLAGSNIARAIANQYNFIESGEFYYGSPIYRRGDVLLLGTHSSVRDLAELPLKPEVAVVASRHKSDSGKPTLTCHATGNFGQAQMGGQDNAIQLTNALYLRQSLLLLREMREKYRLPHEVSMEVTHHGPTGLGFPLLYVEVGSDKTQWMNQQACHAVAEAIYEILFHGVEEKSSAIGFGGPHYAPNFNQVVGNYAVGHIMSKHAVEYLSRSMVEEMIDKTLPKPKMAAVDWKGLKSKDKGKLTEILDEVGINWIKTSEMK